MKIFLLILSLCVWTTSEAQYYLRGEIKDEKDNFLSNVKILLHSSGYLYYSGTNGGFGIEIPQPTDSVTIRADGFQPISIEVTASQFQSIVLKPLFVSPTPLKPALLSATRNRKKEDIPGWSVGAETYNSLIENEFIPTGKYPQTGFAVNIDKASYSNVRRLLNMGITVPPDAVRIEEMLNYFNVDYKAPVPDSVFGMQTYLSDCPWNKENQLLFLHLCARKINLEKIPPANLVFLIDISGSMDLPNRLPLLKSAFQMLVENLREKDTVSIVVYGSTVGVWLPPTPGKEKDKITEAIEDLEPGGPTPGEEGIKLAYRLAANQFIHGGNNRIILATDGDFNVGENTEEELEKLIVMNKHWGIYLTCLGVGMGNYKDSKLQVLAERGSGNFAYLDNVREAQKVLMQEFTQTLYSVADDSYLDISFNPDLIKSYRLIGFDNKASALSDSLARLAGGEIGSGHSLTAIFEITPSDSPVNKGKALVAEGAIHYRLPHDSATQYVSPYTCPDSALAFSSLPRSMQFSSTVALFGALLRKSKYLHHTGWNEAIELTRSCYDKDNTLQKEFLDLMIRAKKLYAHEKRNKGPQ